MPDQPKIKVYSLLSLNEARIRRVLPGAIISGPIKRWDLQQDIEDKINIVAIIDGHFEQVRPVVPAEIMDALRSGVKVYGSSSMGAMRAAELHPFGMIGFGKIFEKVCADPAFRDDFLGQMIFDDANQHMTMPYIDFYFNLMRHFPENISRVDKDKIEKAFSSIHFSQRNRLVLLQLTKEIFKRDQKKVARLIKAFNSKHSQKGEDALGLLRLIKRDIENLRKLQTRAKQLEPEVRAGIYAKYWAQWK